MACLLGRYNNLTVWWLMIHYFTNRELSQKLEINLARWKRWSRAFLPPDPLGGMQSGYARQYLFKDLFKVYLGGHLLAHVKLSVADSHRVLEDLSPWLKKNGYFDWNGINGEAAEKEGFRSTCRIYFSPLRSVAAKSGSEFRYLIRETVNVQSPASTSSEHVRETYADIMIHAEVSERGLLLQDPELRMVNLAAVYANAVHRLCRHPD